MSGLLQWATSLIELAKRISVYNHRVARKGPDLSTSHKSFESSIIKLTNRCLTGERANWDSTVKQTGEHAIDMLNKYDADLTTA